MSRKQHTSARGVKINFDELTRRNPNVIAVGNVKMNARGDRLGPGGKVIRKVEDIPGHKLPSPGAPYNTSNKKSIKLVSLKDDLTTETLKGKTLAEIHRAEDAKTPDQVFKELDEKKIAKITAAKEAAASKAKEEVETVEEDSKETSKSKRKIVDTDE